ncbi:MAG: alanine racemase [Nitrospirales bacterium]|nr:alanine racemase [Nitrospirales bacterium]
MTMQRGVTAEIDLGAIAHNLGIVRALAPNRPVMAVVKADAYGHGSVEVARFLSSLGVEFLAVAFTDEARELREAGINAPLVVLFGYNAGDVFDYDLIPVVHDKREAIALSREAEKRGRAVAVHIKVDTGMGRLGLNPESLEEILEIASFPGIRIAGLMSHFSEADLLDTSFALTQISRVTILRDILAKRGLLIPLLHMANSAAVLSLPQAHFDAVRPGLMLYGYSPVQKAEDRGQKTEDRRQSTAAPHPSLVTGGAEGGLSSGLATPNLHLLPAMTVKAKLLAIRRLPANTPVSYGRTFITQRESLIGVVSVGYADGFARSFSGNALFSVRGRMVPVVGRVCMDLTMVDLTGLDELQEGDDVIILGSGGEDACELALRVGTIPYEILTSLGTRAKKIYKT